MMKKIFKLIFVAIGFSFLINPINILAAANFGDLSYRTTYNSKMYTTANNSGKVGSYPYIDKFLADLPEVGNKSISASDQTTIKNLANEIVTNSGATTEIEKIKAFHDFIRDNLNFDSDSSTTLGTSYNNPVTIVNYYNQTKSNSIPAKSNGYVALFIALARSVNIPARAINGYYETNARNNEIDWGNDITTSNVNHIWCEAYVSNRWVVIDIVADDYTNGEDIDTYGSNYFDITYQNLSKTHIIFSYGRGSIDRRFVTNSYESTKLKTFLNINSSGIQNGKRLNNQYDSSDIAVWFKTSSGTNIDANTGRITRIYFPKNKNVYGTLDLNSFTKLTYIEGSYNKLTSVTANNCSELKTVYLYNNSLTKAYFTGNKKLTYLSLKNNPLTYVKYNFKNGTKTAIVKATTGGTISVHHQKKSKKYRHKLIAKASSDYKFKGWYRNGKRVSTKKTLTFYKSTSFTYTAKFVKKPYIVVSIAKQKLWFYEGGKLKYTTKVVTGDSKHHNTPKGTYYIKKKRRNLYLIGPDYRSWVNYWMPLYPNNHIGLHDATWRTSFGGTIYKRNGSHGCINLPYNAAKKIYAYTPLNTKVIIK